MGIEFRKFNANLGASGSYSSANLTLGPLLTVFNVSTGSTNRYSGQITDITISTTTSSNKVEIDLLFFPNPVTLLSNIGQTFSMSYSDVRTCIGKIHITDADFSTIDSSAIASIYTNNPTFNGNSLYMASIFQHTSGPPHTFVTGSMYINVGYSLT